MNAKGFYDPVKPTSSKTSLAAPWAGPIKKDKTFIFGSYEGRRIKQGISSNPVPLPTAANLAGDFSNQTPFRGHFDDAHGGQCFANRCGTALSPQANTELANIQAGATPTPKITIFYFPVTRFPRSALIRFRSPAELCAPHLRRHCFKQPRTKPRSWRPIHH